MHRHRVHTNRHSQSPLPPRPATSRSLSWIGLNGRSLSGRSLGGRGLSGLIHSGHDLRGFRLALWTVLSLCLPGCSPETDERPAATSVQSTEESSDVAPTPGRSYLRSVVFIDVSQDTTMLMVVWDFESRSEPGRVARSIRGWLARAGEWNQFMEDEWTTDPSRAPWRIIPRGSARLTMGEDDALESIAYREGLRDLVTVVGPTLREWRGQNGEIYRLSQGTALLSGEASEGYILDVSTARLTSDPPPLEWGLLVSEGNLQFLLAAKVGSTKYQAWGIRDFQDLAWPEVLVTWAGTRSFERARREVPVQWELESTDGELSGEFESVSSHLQTLEGDGARLPLLGVYEISGSLSLGGVQADVRGFLRHIQR